MTPRLVAIINFYKLKSTPLCSYKQNLLSQYMYFPNCWALYWPNHIIKMWSLTSLTFFCAGQFSLTLFFDFVLQSVSLIIFTFFVLRVKKGPLCTIFVEKPEFEPEMLRLQPGVLPKSYTHPKWATHIQNELHKSLMSFTHPYTCYITSPYPTCVTLHPH